MARIVEDRTIASGGKPTKQEVDDRVRSVMDAYREGWESRYGFRPAIRGKDRSGLRDLVVEVGRPDLVAAAVRAFLADEGARVSDAGHPLAWFLATANGYIVKLSKKRGKDEERAKFERDARRFRDEVGSD